MVLSGQLPPNPQWQMSSMIRYYSHLLHFCFISAPLLPRLPVLSLLVSSCPSAVLFSGSSSEHFGTKRPCPANVEHCPVGSSACTPLPIPAAQSQWPRRGLEPGSRAWQLSELVMEHSPRLLAAESQSTIW